VHYRQRAHEWGTIDEPAGVMAGASGKIVSLLSRMNPVTGTCAGAVVVRNRPAGLILDARIAGSAAGWPKASPDASAAGVERESGNKEHRVPGVARA
jgi:hypothetical protein